MYTWFLLWNISCPLATFRPLLFSATHSYTPASSGRKYGISRTPLEWLILILPGSGIPSALLHEMEGTGLQRSHTKKVTLARRTSAMFVSLFVVMEGVWPLRKFAKATRRVELHRANVSDTYFPKAKHSSFTDDPLETWRVSGNWTSIFGSYSPITTA